MPGNSQLRTSGVCKSTDVWLAMRFLGEMVLSLLVVGVVLCLYFVAAGTALLALWFQSRTAARSPSENGGNVNSSPSSKTKVLLDAAVGFAQINKIHNEFSYALRNLPRGAGQAGQCLPEYFWLAD
jgi:hypothetical protein